MTLGPRFAAMLTWLPALASLALGVLLRDCVMLSASALLAMKGFHDRMDRDAPLRPLSAVLRCLRAGLASALLAAALAAMLVAGFLDGWHPANDQPLLVGALLVLVPVPVLMRVPESPDILAISAQSVIVCVEPPRCHAGHEYAAVAA